MRKRAVSPLIATVLLIAFAVALGAVVMNWGKTQLSDPSTGEGGACSGVNILIEQIGSVPKICTRNGTLEFLANNAGTSPIHKLKLTIIPQSGEPINAVIKESIFPGDTKKYESDIPDESGRLQKIRITPVIMSNDGMGKDELCTAAIIEAIQINEC